MGVILLLCAVFVVKSAWAQSDNPRAANWFKQGLAEKKPQKKIAAYTRAIEIDPQFVEAVYNLGLVYMQLDEMSPALASLEKVRQLSPNYRDTEALIAKIESEMQLQIASTVTLRNYYNTLYQDALKSIENADWLQAVLKLEKLRVLKPDDHEIVNLLAQARSNLKLAAASGAEESLISNYPPMIFLGGALAAAIVLPMLGMLFFSPTSRARFQFLRRNYLKAAQIYERLLSQHPERVKLYVTLANIYLLVGRDDERALRVYKMVLNLNLAAHMHPQIHSILMQKYLTNGAGDSEAIAALETALRTEQKAIQDANLFKKG
jgi:tetratricopeptide (TPR) repeat protein